MPTAGSNKSRYKIPDDLNPSGICCISVPVPDDPEWIAMFMGAIWRMSLQTHYEREPTQSGKVAAAKWREIWTEVQMGTCCGATVNDITNNTQINVQVQTYLFELEQIYIAAGFDIDVAFPETPDLFDSDPGDVGDEIAQRDRALCLVTQSFVNEVFNRGLSWLQSQTEEVAGLITAGILIPWVPVYAVVGAFVGAGVLAGAIVLELASAEYRKYITCGMYDALKGQDTNSKLAFFASADSLPVRPPPPQSPLQDFARDVIEIWLRSQLNNTENYLGFIKSLNIAMGMALPLATSDCICADVCATYADDLDTGLGLNTHLRPDPAIPVPVGVNGPGGVWDAGAGETAGGIDATDEGWPAPPFGNYLTAETFIEVDPGCTIAEVTYRVNYANGGPARGHALDFYDDVGVLVATEYNATFSPPAGWQDSGATGMSVTGATWIRIFDQSATPGKDPYVRQDSINVVFS